MRVTIISSLLLAAATYLEPANAFPSLVLSGRAVNSTSSSNSTSNVTVISDPVVAVPNSQANTNIKTAAQVVSLNSGTNTTSGTNATTATNLTVVGHSVSSTILVIARDTASAYSAYSGLNGYGIPYQILAVPQAGATLPTLNSSATVGNFGAIVILSEVSYDYGAAGFNSALTTDQWTQLYNYQLAFGIRMVRLDVYPSADTGTTTTGGCCLDTQEQLISITNSTGFPTAGLKLNAGMSTQGLYHYPATITNSSIAWSFASFGTSTGYKSATVAGVINQFGTRQQMVFFTSFATDWSSTSNLLQHAWIHWATRGVYQGYRRINFNTQIDDMFLESDIYYPANNTFRIRPADLTQHISWTTKINAKLPAGSNYFIEIGHNGNGNIESSSDIDTKNACSTGAIEYDDQLDTPLEFQKPLGTGTNIWPSGVTNYPYTSACAKLDPLNAFFANTANRDAFGHISHTFTHESENNSTYYDINKEISWNKAWLTQIGLAAATKFSPKGLIPPAITGLHNGDALQAWWDNGIRACVGDNTRPVLMNTENEHWPYITTKAANGFDGMQVTPRWATNIYYNCDSADCTLAEWIATSAGAAGNITTLLEIERQANSRHLLGLHHDPFMFHQANLRYTDVTNTVVNGASGKYSLLQMWVETVINEMTRLVTWPVVTLKHDDISASFAARMARDQCVPSMAYTLDTTGKKIVGVVVSTKTNSCSVPIPVTLPGAITNTGFTTEQLGSDPLTVWVPMSGSSVSLTLKTPVAL